MPRMGKLRPFWWASNVEGRRTLLPNLIHEHEHDIHPECFRSFMIIISTNAAANSVLYTRTVYRYPSASNILFWYITHEIAYSRWIHRGCSSGNIAQYVFQHHQEPWWNPFSPRCSCTVTSWNIQQLSTPHTCIPCHDKRQPRHRISQSYAYIHADSLVSQQFRAQRERKYTVIPLQLFQHHCI